jgi:hypothetical protein
MLTLPLPRTCCLFVTLQPRLMQVYDKSTPKTGLHLALELSFAPHLVKHAGAPLKAWLLLESPPTSHSLHVTLVWQGKTATRLPEALWLRFKPGRGSVDPESWLLHKLDGAISPSEVCHTQHTAFLLALHGCLIQQPLVWWLWICPALYWPWLLFTLLTALLFCSTSAWKSTVVTTPLILQH